MTLPEQFITDVLVDAKSGFACGKHDEDGVFQIRMNNIGRDGSLDLSQQRRVPKSEKGIKSCKLEKGDVLFNATNSPELVGKTAFFDGYSEPVTFSNHFLRLRPKPDSLDGRYLAYWLIERFQAGVFKGLCRQWVNQATVSREALLKLKIPLPPLSEQKRIAEILDRAEALRAKRRAALALLDELTQSIFLDMFGDPVSNPKGWPVRVFDDVCDSRLGKMLDAKKQVGDNPRPYMRNINVQWGKLDLSTVWQMDFNEKDREEFRLLPDDVLICEGGAGVAQTAVWRGDIAECYFQKSLHRVRPKPCSATSEYIAFLIRMLMRKGSELFRLVSSATIPHLTGVKLKTLRIPVPPVQLQCRFGVATESVAQQKARMQASLSELDQLFASLQHRAFRGELS